MATPKLTDALKTVRRKPAPVAPPAPAPVVVNTYAVADIAAAMQTGMAKVTGLPQTVMEENQRLLTLLTEQNETQSGQLADIHKRQPVRPILKIPPRPQKFDVELKKDSQGNTTGMRVTAERR